MTVRHDAVKMDLQIIYPEGWVKITDLLDHPRLRIYETTQQVVAEIIE